MDLWTIIDQRPCRICQSFIPAGHFRVVANPTAPVLYSGNPRPRKLRDFLDSRRSGCLGCGLVIDALEEWGQGWTKDPANEAESIEIHFEFGLLSLYHWVGCERNFLFHIFQPQGLYWCFFLLRLSSWSGGWRDVFPGASNPLNTTDI